jgi:hypothetical protein
LIVAMKQTPKLKSPLIKGRFNESLTKINETPALKSGWRILLMLQTAVKAKTG